MTLSDEIDRILEEIVSSRDKLTDGTNEGIFNNLSFHLGKLEQLIRESIQETTLEDILPVIDRLESGSTLSKKDRDLIRLWIIGDAERYVRMESEHQDWLAELIRHIETIGELRDNDHTVDNMGRISGTIREAIRVIGNIVYFKSQEERIARFNAAIDRLEPEDMRMIAGVLKDKIRSSRL